jgi:hypothetical protein
MAEVDSELLVDGDDDRGNSSSGHCSRRLELEGVATPSAEDGGAVHPLGWRWRGGAVVAEDGSRGEWQWRVERTLREEEGKWERVSSGDAHMWG